MFLRPRIDTVEANKQYEENKKYHETNDRNNDRNNDRKKIKIYNDTEYEIVIDNEIKENKKIKKVYTQSHKFKLLFLLTKLSTEVYAGLLYKLIPPICTAEPGTIVIG